MEIQELEEMEEILELFPYVSERQIIERMDHFVILSDVQFAKRFRLTKESVMVVLSKIERQIAPPSQRNNAVSARIRLLLALRFYATGSMIISVADFCGISVSSASTFLKQVSLAICSLRQQYIKMPKGHEIREVQQFFYQTARFPLVVGAIDCTHVRIQSPGGEYAENFRNRKGYFSINVQTIADPDLKIRDIVTRWPGAAHDLTIFNNSRVRSRFERGEFGSALLLGDAGYQNRSYLVTPLQRPGTQAENLYNESHIRTRNCVERQYGVWKRRFPVLKLEMRLNIERVQAVIVATAILHNIAIEMNETEPPIEFHVNDEEVVPVPPVDVGNGNRRAQLINHYFTRL